ncbi:calcium-binding protein [Paraburkholderia megapolitana]|uniref:calcium-binding protein n=1 Tax=Paraburkholderia megapolitana TaxID=420953 RepID=UPI000B8031BF|nr:calcium-binding protein [Paraburkholderia megapolitana]QDQ82270.1 hypothetical protein FNZ07_13325 [Paraburkholderia megapolitana]
MEIVFDTYTEDECATARYCHLDSQLSFPFKTRVRQAMDCHAPTRITFSGTTLGPGPTPDQR